MNSRLIFGESRFIFLKRCTNKFLYYIGSINWSQEPGQIFLMDFDQTLKSGESHASCQITYLRCFFKTVTFQFGSWHEKPVTRESLNFLTQNFSINCKNEAARFSFLERMNIQTYGQQPIIQDRDHSFSTFTRFCEKLIFLSPDAHAFCSDMLAFRKILGTY